MAFYFVQPAHHHLAQQSPAGRANAGLSGRVRETASTFAVQLRRNGRPGCASHLPAETSNGKGAHRISAFSVSELRVASFLYAVRDFRVLLSRSRFLRVAERTSAPPKHHAGDIERDYDAGSGISAHDRNPVYRAEFSCQLSAGNEQVFRLRRGSLDSRDS